MKKFVRLENVIDTRTGKEHSVAIVEERKAKYFVPIEDKEE